MEALAAGTPLARTEPMRTNDRRGSTVLEYLVLLLLLGLTVTGYGFALAEVESRAAACPPKLGGTPAGCVGAP
jgi:hypothetical protein